MRRIALATVALAMTTAPLAVMVDAQAAPHTTASATGTKNLGPRVDTDFGMLGSSYATRVFGGAVPVESGTTARANIGCTTKTGREAASYLANVDLSGLATVSGLSSAVNTVKEKGKVSTIATHSIGALSLGLEGLGSLSINGITSTATTFHDKATGFGSDATTSVGTITLTPAVGDPVELPIPSPDQPVEIPGLLKINLGKTNQRADEHSAFSRALALVVTLEATGTKIQLASAQSQMTDGILIGRFAGYADAVSANIADGLVSVKRPLVKVMPCKGTEGDLEKKLAAGLSIPGVLDISQLVATQKGSQSATKAKGFEISNVGTVNLGDGQLVIKGLQAQVNVVRSKGGQITKNFDGSSLGSITVNGEEMSPEDLDGFEIPGVAKISTMLTRKFKSGAQITLIRVELLGGTAGTIDIGTARLGIGPKG